MRTVAVRLPRLRTTARRRPGRTGRRIITARPRRPVRFVFPSKRTFAPRTGRPREVIRNRNRVRRPERTRRGFTRTRIRGFDLPRAPEFESALPPAPPAAPASGQRLTTSPPAVRATVWLGGGGVP